MINRLVIFAIIILVIGYSCKTDNSNIDINNSPIDSLNTILQTLGNKRDSLIKIESDLYAKLIYIKPQSPAGFSINYNSATYGIGNILFAGNNHFKLDGGKYQTLLKHNKSKKYRIVFVDLYGDWRIEKDSIFIHATLAAGKKFLKNDSWGASFNEIIDTTLVLNWTEIVLNSMSRKDNPLTEKQTRILYDNVTNSNVLNKDSLFGDYTFLSVRQIDQNEIKNTSKEKLRIMRNEIYARYGYQFKDSSMTNYFNNQIWYKKKYFDCDLTDYLTDIEKYNIDLIKNYEDGKKL